MRWLLFIARVTFICNLFFIVCLLIRHTHFTIPPGFTEFAVINGWIMSVVFNILFATCTVIFAFRKVATGIPLWLKGFDILSFVFQMIYFIISEL